MQKIFKIFYGILLLSSSSVFLTECFIVPQEIPSLLSLVYSNIPPIKKGTDSRIGFGYRFGDHADFQVQFEIGPQKETQPIGTASPSKRNIRPADEFQIERALRKEKIKEQDTTTKGPSWLSNWFTQFTKSFQQAALTTTTTTRAPKVIKLPEISPSALQQLQRLYQKSEGDEDVEYESESIESKESSPIVEVASTTISESFSHQLPPVVVAILRENRSQQPHRSKEKIESITRDLSNVDLD